MQVTSHEMVVCHLTLLRLCLEFSRVTALDLVRGRVFFHYTDAVKTSG